MNRTRSLGVEQHPVLADGRVDHGHDQLVEDLGGARDDVDVAVRDRVVGPGTDGDVLLVGVRCHGCGSGCPRSGVRRWWSASGRAARAGRTPTRRAPRPPAPAGAAPRAGLPARPPPGRAGRGRRDRIGARPPVRSGASASASARTSSASAPSASTFARSARCGGRRGLDERGARGAARERLEPERARAGEQVEHARRPRRGRPGSRTAPRGRGPRSGASPRPPAPAGGGRRSGPRSRARDGHAGIGSSASAP